MTVRDIILEKYQEMENYSIASENYDGVAHFESLGRLMDNTTLGNMEILEVIQTPNTKDLTIIVK